MTYLQRATSSFFYLTSNDFNTPSKNTNTFALVHSHCNCDKHIWLVIYTRSTLSKAYSAGDSLTRVS